MPLYEKLYTAGLISPESYQRLKAADTGLFSIGFELKTLLYAGVLLFTSGLGIAIYKNIDTIGHLVIIGLIAVASAGSFLYCYKNAKPYSNEKVNSPNIFFDYILLLAGLTLVSFIGYLQYQYSVFGPFNGLTFLIPAIILFASAYYFDHIGILTIAITSFAAFAGISASPLELMESSNYSTQPLIYTGIVLGAIMVAAGWTTTKKNIKKHFSFTYYNFGAHLLFIFIISGLFENNILIFAPLLAVTTFVFVRYARMNHSFYFMLVAVVYAYFGLTYLFFRFMSNIGFEILGVYVAFVYLILTSIFIIRYLKQYRNKLRLNDHLQ